MGTGAEGEGVDQKKGRVKVQTNMGQMVGKIIGIMIMGTEVVEEVGLEDRRGEGEVGIEEEVISEGRVIREEVEVGIRKKVMGKRLEEVKVGEAVALIEVEGIGGAEEVFQIEVEEGVGEGETGIRAGRGIRREAMIGIKAGRGLREVREGLEVEGVVIGVVVMGTLGEVLQVGKEVIRMIGSHSLQNKLLGLVLLIQCSWSLV